MSFNTMRDKLHLAGEGYSFTKTSDGVFTLLPAVAYDRLITIYAIVTEAFADGTGTATAAKVGQGNDDDKFAEAAVVNWMGGINLEAVTAPYGSNGPSLNKGLGLLSADQPLILTVAPAVGNGTGGAIVAAVAIAAIAAA